MVHWPEVMVTWDETDRVLFSADAFGAFGAVSGFLFADEVDFARDWLDDARRYYTNIVGKYGAPVQALLKRPPPWTSPSSARCMDRSGVGTSPGLWKNTSAGAPIGPRRTACWWPTRPSTGIPKTPRRSLPWPCATQA